MSRKPVWFLIAGVIACFAIAALAYFWATAQMDSLYAYRSPLAEQPPAPAAPASTALSGRVVFVLVDALREDTSLKPDAMPFLAELRTRGASATMHSRPPSFSAPAYTVLFTGAWPDLSDGPALNLAYDQYSAWTQDNLFSAAHRAGLSTAVSGFNWFEKLIPQEAVAASFYTAGEDAAADRAVVDAALPWLANGKYQLILIHLDQVDYAGHHEGGPRDPRWDAAATRVDDHLREIAATLDLGRDTLLVVSDHGQIDRGGHGGQDPITLIEPFVLVGAGVKPGSYGDVNQVDVAPTLAVLLGANIPATAQGRALAEMLALTADQTTAAGRAIERAETAQQAQLAAAYGAALNRPITAISGADPVAGHQAAMMAARSARLNGERLPRAALGLALLGLLIAVAYRKRGRDLAWMAAATSVYLLVFNLRYAVVQGRTYSLSSVLSADELILSTAVTASLAMLAGWAVVVIGTRLYRRSPGDAARLVLAWTLFTVAIAGLPALISYVLNGPVVGWTLPDFGTFFLGFLAVVQALFVAAVGLVLAGLTALTARLARPTLKRQMSL